MINEDFGAMTDEQQERVALALYQLTPDQLVKVLHTIVHTLAKCYGKEVRVRSGQVEYW